MNESPLLDLHLRTLHLPAILANYRRLLGELIPILKQPALLRGLGNRGDMSLYPCGDNLALDLGVGRRGRLGTSGGKSENNT